MAVGRRGWGLVGGACLEDGGAGGWWEGHVRRMEGLGAGGRDMSGGWRGWWVDGGGG